MRALYVILTFTLLLTECHVLADFASRISHPCKAPENGHPRGHFDRLGCQRSPTGGIDEYIVAPSARELWEKNVKPYRPAVLRNGLADSFALSAWNDDYLISNYGDQEVLIEKKYEDRRSEPKRMIISEFLANYHKENWYVVSLLPNAMRTDIRIPKPLMCSTFRKNLAELNLWIGTNGTRSMLHYDADNILHCVVSGLKDWMLFHPKYKPKLDMVLNPDGQASGFSHLNVDKIDKTVHPEVWDVPWEYVTLKGGDCIYLPARYLHQVTSYERSISVTFLFYPEGGFSDEDCKDVDYGMQQNLKDAYVYWTLEKGQETVDMGYMNPESTKKSFLVGLEIIGEVQMDFKTYLYVTGSQNEEFLEARYFEILANFKKLDQNDDDVITVNEIKTLDMEIWKEWCRVLENPHGPMKSDLHKNKKFTSQISEFSPRPPPNSMDSSYALIFLKFVVRALGKNEKITYTEFKKWIQVQNGTASEAFLIFDKNVDGVMTLNEVQNAPSKHLRDFSKLYYSVKGTSISGGGISAGEVAKHDLRYLVTLNSIPTSSLSEFVETEDEDRQYQVFKNFLQTLKQLLLTEKEIHEDTFSKMTNMYGPDTIDIGFFFQILDRGDKGYISQLDVEYFIADEKIFFFPQSEAHYGGEIENEGISPCEAVIRILSLKDRVDEVLLAAKKYAKEKAASGLKSKKTEL